MSATSEEDPQPSVGDARQAAIDDTVFSANGNAFLAVLANDDLMVGLGRPTKPRAVNLIKGAGISKDLGDNKVNDLGVNNAGTRVVMRAGDEVHVASLAGFKLLLADHPRNAIDTADGTHIVHARGSFRGAAMWMTPIESLGQGPSLRRDWRVDLPDLPRRITAGPEAVLVRIAAKNGRRDETVWLHSMQSGAVLAGPLDAEALFVGPQDRWVLTRRGPGQLELLRSATGHGVRRWDVPDGSPGGIDYVLSPAREAVAILMPAGPGGS